jgi:hypothetical protein
VGSYVKIELYKGEVFCKTVVSSTENDGNHPWSIPRELFTGSDYKIKITSISDSSIYDYSDGYFSITIPEETHYGDLIISGSDVYQISDKTLVVKGNVIVKDNAKLKVSYGNLMIEQTAADEYSLRVEGGESDRPSMEFEWSTLNSNFPLKAYFISSYNDIKFVNSWWKGNVDLKWTYDPNVYITNTNVEGGLWLANHAQVHVTDSTLKYVWQDCCLPDMWLTNSTLYTLDFGTDVEPYGICYVNNSRIDKLNLLANMHGKIYVWNGSTIGEITEEGPNYVEIIYNPPPTSTSKTLKKSLMMSPVPYNY